MAKQRKNYIQKDSAKEKPLHVQVAEGLIEQLKAGTAPWQKPWNRNGVPAFQLPYNAISGNRYKGINTFSLLLKGYADPRWVTYNQAASQDWQVRKGEKSSPVQFVKLYEMRSKRDSKGNLVLDEKGKPREESVKLDRPIITSARVFNAAQIDGIPELEKIDITTLDWNPVERAEALIQSSGADIFHRAGDRAYYSPMADQITMPLRTQFDAADKYYATLLHELGHWTGHSSRLDRSIMNQFGSDAYVREELRAEIASLLIGQELKIGHDPGQHTAYVQSWIKLLTDTPFEIHAAAADAEKIFVYLTSLERKRELTAGLPEPIMESAATKNGNKYLSIGDQIPYNETIYKVLRHLKQGRLCMEDAGTGNQFTLSRTDGLYTSLLNAKNEQTQSLKSTTQEQNAGLRLPGEQTTLEFIRTR